MIPPKPLRATLALALLAGLTACSSPSSEPSGDASGYVTDGTWVMTTVADPGALDPHMSIVSAVFEMTGYAYDYLLNYDSDGELVSHLATEWTHEDLSASFEIQSGVTCSDGSTLSAQTVADNINWVSDLENASPYLGSFLPVGLAATADGDTVNLELAEPVPFLLEAMTGFPIVCDAGIEDRSQLESATLGSGPYELTEAVPDDHYTYERRDGYTWGPDGASTDQAGLPKTITVRVVPNESTAVNLLLAGEVNTVASIGTDADRLDAANITSVNVDAVLGETFLNQGADHLTSDLAVRTALTQAVDLDELATVLSGGKGGRATQMAVIPPATCDYDSVAGNLPEYDTAGATATMEAAGYTKGADGKFSLDGSPVSLTFYLDSTLGTTGQAAAELAVQQWEAAGFTIEMSQLDTTRLVEILFGTGDWDIAWTAVNTNGPDQLVSMFSGPGVADGGSNFSNVANDAYDAAVAVAMTKTGDQACTAFAEAEAELFKAVNFVPWGLRPNQIYFDGVEYEYVGRTQVTALRLLAG